MSVTQPWHESVRMVDMHYIAPEKAASYVILEGGQAAIIDHTKQAIPHLEKELAAHGLGFDDVAYLIITHVHLDHAGGTGHLAQLCPNAQVLAHPRAARHLVNPERVAAGSRAVYGDAMFEQLYGELIPVPEDRIRAMADGETLSFGERTLRFEHTLGHATHHFVIFDDKSEGVFAGDTMGAGRSTLLRPGISWSHCVTAPPDFDAAEAIKVVERIVASGVRFAFISHFAVFDEVSGIGAQVIRTLERMQAIIDEALEKDIADSDLMPWCIEQTGLAMDEHLRAMGVEDFETERRLLDGDQIINGMGLAHVVRRTRSKPA